MPVTSSRRGNGRIAVGEEGRRATYRTSTFTAQKKASTPYSVISYERKAPRTLFSPTFCWFFKQISPGLLMILLFFSFRNLDRQTQLRLVRYVSDKTDQTAGAIPMSHQDHSEREQPPRLGSRVPSGLENLADLSTMYNPKTDTPYFWDIHFAGETVAESVFTKCHFLIQACEHGLKQPDYNDEKLEVFETAQGALYVNVDTTTKQGIRRAKLLGLAQQRLADVMMSPELHLFTSNIFSPYHKGRMFALFRNPIDRAVSMYHYLASASWDPHYNPQLRVMSLLDYAKSSSVENNWMTRFLVNKPGGTLNKNDIVVAKETLRTKCLVGLFEDLGNSLTRFQIYFNWSPKSPTGQIQKCRSAVLEAGEKRHGVNALDETSEVYLALANANKYDMELYEYTKVLYGVQGEQIFGIPNQ